jgi:hypothetical protein
MAFLRHVHVHTVVHPRQSLESGFRNSVWLCTVHPPNLLVTSGVTSHDPLLVSQKSLCAPVWSYPSGPPKWADWSPIILIVHHSVLYIYLTYL